ncbi:pyridoxamine 5'-phosphate oxidase-like protein [Nocardia tenerifensis]|uniref:Pyridoxamine 5'-phosphate oxidase-like protein n=1 Tax=Nocardia tenerifensis TaxID=228006 RepID=A0A318KCD0_9NOCA|nr:pyridoxamine 5'-phosphate oxidase family protein [Nocardia tenerifensis]PXX69186.1 pyridoxamine 5'-phosphate oxidase-like protein [Nocardia tenerifensis]
MPAYRESETRELSVEDSLDLLHRVRFGRIAFSRHALPTIRPVRHTVVDGCIVIPADQAMIRTLHRQVVAYEVDTIDHHTNLGRCVIITGVADTVMDEQELDHYRLYLSPEIAQDNQLIVIDPDIITGIEYVSFNGA